MLIVLALAIVLLVAAMLCPLSVEASNAAARRDLSSVVAYTSTMLLVGVTAAALVAALLDAGLPS